MRHTLRRSCGACARSKHSCDLATPRCSRCIKRKVECVYANEPLTAQTPSPRSEPSGALTSYRLTTLDPFDSYPSTRLPREHVNRLIHNFLHKIAFQYYPLDLNTTTNPFLVSWWPLALEDSALFHVSLQTACLDEELLAQKGFYTSQLLMADSVALLRHKVGDESLAVQDGTMNSVITLATIEYGKGNIKVAEMHVKGVKKLVDLRGGIRSVTQTSPLTARMVSWVSMLIMGYPQFEAQDDAGIGLGIPPIPEWSESPEPLDITLGFSLLGVNHHIGNIFVRLRSVFHGARQKPLTSTRLHDLTCFVIHRLLHSIPETPGVDTSPLAESIRYAIILYMFLVQGPTYYSHAVIFNQILDKYAHHVKQLEFRCQAHDSLDVWLLAVGMVSSVGTSHYGWLMDRAREISPPLQIGSWDDAFYHVRSVLWLERRQAEDIFRAHWEAVLGSTNQPQAADLTHFVPSSNTGTAFI